MPPQANRRHCAATAEPPPSLRRNRGTVALRRKTATGPAVSCAAGPICMQADKPDSVVEWPSIWAARCRAARATEPGSLGRATLKRFPIWSCTGRGLPSRPVTRPLVGSYPTFSPLPAPPKRPLAVYFLLRFPSGLPGWPLASVLLCGVRTFLDREPRELRRATRRGPTAATWLAFSVYHRGRRSDTGPRIRSRVRIDL